MNKILIFGLGAAVGSLLTWKLLEVKYKKLADEEIKSVVEHYKEKEELEKNIGKTVVLQDKKEFDKVVGDSEPFVKVEKPMTETDYNKLTNKLGYDYEKDDDEIITEDEDGSIWVEAKRERVAPYVISPEEFGESDSYETKSWTLYSDGIITDEAGEIVDDPEIIIGDALKHFGDYEDDSVHVRNENTECDYEIIKYEKAFSEINEG